MPKKMLVIDPLQFTIEERLFAEPVKVREGMYIKAEGNGDPDKDGMLHIAYVYPVEARGIIEDWFHTLEAKKKDFDDTKAHFQYQVLPSLRRF